MQDQLLLKENTSWPEVWLRWKQREAGIWNHHFSERGFNSWEAWRETYVRPFNLRNRFWKLVEICDPNMFIPKAWAGGFRGWRNYYPEGIKEMRFQDLAKLGDVQNNRKVKELFNNFPKTTEIILFRYKDEFVVFEGMHRCTALTLAAEKGKKIHGTLKASVTVFNEDEAELFTKAKQEINK